MHLLVLLVFICRPQEKRFSDSAEMEGKVMVRIQGRKMTLCKHYLHGNCKNGSNCSYLHDPCRKNKSLCKAFVRGYCSRVGKEFHSPIIYEMIVFHR